MGLICNVLFLYVIVLFVRAVLSWFPATPGGAMGPVRSFVFTLTEPVLGPLRRTIPPIRIGSIYLDVSFIVAILGISVLSSLIC